MADQQDKPIASLSYARAGNGGRTSVDDDYNPDLRGSKGRRTIAKMLNSSTVGGAMTCITNIFKTTDFHVDPAQGVTDPDLADELAKWVYRTLTTMGDPTYLLSATWTDFLDQLASALPYGWAFVDITRKPQADGTIGVGQVVQVHPDTLADWLTDETGRVRGIIQYPPTGQSQVSVPSERAVHFVPIQYKGSPEGRSLLRAGYDDWYYSSKLKEFRAILAERMSGFPVVTANADIKMLATDMTLPEETRAKYAEMVREIESIAPKIKVNRQAGATLWSKPYENLTSEGERSFTSVQQLQVQLLTPSGGTAVDYDRAIQDHDMAVARSMLLQFLFMGGSGTSGAQNAMGDMVEVFEKAAEAWLCSLYNCLERQLLPMLWRWNGYDPAYMPTLRHGVISRESLDALGRYVQSLASAGVVLTDPETEEELRLRGNLPVPSTLGEKL